MQRREFVTLLGGAAATWPFIVHAQEPRKRPLIVSLGSPTAATAKPQFDAFLEGLRSLGYVEGRDLDIVQFWADGVMQRLPQLAQEAVRFRPDVIFANPTPGVLAAKAASATIPIVCFMLTDEIRLGLAASDARPGGTVTGLLMRVEGMAGKQVDLAIEMVPTATRIGILFNPTSADGPAQRREVDAATLAHSVQANFAEARTLTEIESAFQQFARDQVHAVIVLYDAIFFTDRRHIAELATIGRLPAIYSARDHVDAGGLISYGVSLRANARRAATYVDKILKGAKPGDLPIEFPTTLELVINLKTAKALGLTVSQTLLARADEVIE